MLVLRWAFPLAVAGCIVQAQTAAQNAISPPATGGGTLTCRQIVEQCDAECTTPMCVRACGDQGTAEAAIQHNALVDCAQANNCLDEACIRSACATEADTCQGPDPVEPATGAPGADLPPPAEPSPAPPDEPVTTPEP